jgi:predicted O-methyltransferase YrrM
VNVREFYAAAIPLFARHNLPSLFHRLLRAARLKSYEDPFPDVVGMSSANKLDLLRLAASFLPQTGEECYLEIGCYQGKSLIAAMSGNPNVSGVACDNFSLFDDPSYPKNANALRHNIQRYGLSERIKLFDCDFRELLGSWNSKRLPQVGMYFYDGAHDEESQYLGIRLVEGILADNAIVFVDDWRFAKDSQSYAERGTRRAIEESSGGWSLDRVLPARYNGDRDLWWNGLAVLSYQRMNRK